MALEKIVKPVKERDRFQLFFLKNDEYEGVEVEEVEEIDFEGIMERLDRGESVFITNKRGQEPYPRSRRREDAEEPWYFIHI